MEVLRNFYRQRILLGLSEGKIHISHLQQIEYHNDVFPNFLGKRLTPGLM